MPGGGAGSRQEAVDGRLAAAIPANQLLLQTIDHVEHRATLRRHVPLEFLESVGYGTQTGVVEVLEGVELGGRQHLVQSGGEPVIQLAGRHQDRQPAEARGVDAVTQDLRQPLDQLVEIARWLSELPSMLLGEHDVEATLNNPAQVGQTGLYFGRLVSPGPDTLDGPFLQAVQVAASHDLVELCHRTGGYRSVSGAAGG